MLSRASLALLAAPLALATAACGPTKSSDGRPRPSTVGTRTGAATSLSIGPAGGSFSSTDGRLTVTVPPNAVAAPVLFTIDEITNTAPGGLGVAYRLGPAGTRLATPAQLAFGTASTGLAIETLAVATQDQSGYWLRPPDLVRNGVASTVTVPATHFSDWALVTASTARDLQGAFTVDSSLVEYPAYVATGQSTLNYAGDGPDRSYYLQWGTLSLPASIASGASTCAPLAQTVDTPVNIAELRSSLARFDWGASGHWELDCSAAGGGTSRIAILAAFDTAGVSNVGCARGYVGTPLLGQDRIQGSYAIDCGARGRLSATWDFVATACGGTCTANPDPVCHLGVVDCSSGAAACVDGAPRPDGTSCNDGNACTLSDTCQAGACTGQSPVACTALDQCHDAGACDPATGICSNPARADGTACSDGDVCTQVDTCQAGTCTGSSPVTCAALDQCHVAGTCDPLTGCSNPAAPDGTACDDGNACTPAQSCQGGVCTASSGVVCTALDQCHDVGTCDPGTGTCSTPARADGTACDDANLCTLADTCQAGSCAPGTPVACTPIDACHLAGTCDPGTGTCSSPAAPDGTDCGGGLTCAGGACTARTVTGTRLVTFWSDAGAAAPAIPADTVVPPLAAVEAWVSDGLGGLRRITGTLAADGSYAIPLVPVGSYLLVVVDGAGAVRAVQTSSSAVDLGWDVLGRQSALPAATATPVDLPLTGLDAWDQAGDEVQLTSASADLQLTALQGAALAAGATAGTASLDWSTAVPGGLPLLATGDLVWVHRLGGRSTGGATPVAYRVATQALSRSDVALTDGQAATVAFDLTAAAVAQTGSLSVDWDTPAFEALLAAMGPSAAATGHTLRVAAGAHALAAPAPLSRLGYPDLLRIDLSAGAARVTPASALAYGQFLGTPWLEWRSATFAARVDYLAAGATTPLAEQVSAGSRDAMSALPTGAIAPTLSPVQAIAVGGASAATPQTGVGLAPVLTWQAPATGAPTRYRVELFQLVPAGATGTGRLAVASFTTGEAGLALPPGLLAAGATYYARVTAQAVAGDGFAAAPLRQSALGAWAGALTATFAP
ncbi:MAG: hypothetical protein HZB56_23340 [Deltaproteobacteria bacterium]|nr:hypothetical protein [Deltaproteobacteria bacterium]